MESFVPLRHFFPLKVVPLIEVLLYILIAGQSGKHAPPDIKKNLSENISTRPMDNEEDDMPHDSDFVL
jgi:hypothetical protein